MERGYTLIELDLYRLLYPDLDLITKCLEIIRQEFPSIVPEGSPGVEYDLIAVTSVHNGTSAGSHYPAIGVYCKDAVAQASVASVDIDNFENRAEDWIYELGFEELIRRATQVSTIDWTKLQYLRTFPNID